MHFTFFRHCPDWLNTNDAPLGNHASIHRALWNDFLTPGSQDGKDMCGSLKFRISMHSDQLAQPTHNQS